MPFLGIALVLTAAGCAAPGESPSSSTSLPPSSDAFTARAEAVAAAWPGAGGFVPLQALLVVPSGLSDEQRTAVDAGWFTLDGQLPAEPPSGEVVFADGSEKLPLIGAAEAYALIDQGDPPPCEPAQGKPSAGGGPDSPVSGAGGACTRLPVTGATPGTVPLRTGRGDATVPAWLFTVRGLTAPIARVAVAPSAITEAPSPSLAPPDRELAATLKGAQSLARVDGTTVDFRLGVGACDEQITPLVYETEALIVLGGSATSSAEMCTEQLVLAPVSVTLAAPAGARTVLDAQTGQAVILQP
ncbi:hypothetical protein [Catenuloplanes japonicus]|uniref:hypothetical protein n=1 Tax=Catenuloplanes japonicus TaxID=33876 RepID=UPI0012F754FC|nr:hypothetical protein [Catenuloplanes japonicus]